MKRKPLSPAYLPVLAQYGLEALELQGLYLLTFERGEYLYRDGLPMEHLMLVVRGRAKVCRASANGKSLLLTFYSGAGILGDIELMLGLTAATSDVQAVSPFTAIGIPFSFAPELLQNHTFVLRLARELARHVDHNTQNSVATVLNPLEARLCSYVSVMAQNGVFHENLTVLAELLGTSYRHLLRTLETLCQNGVLTREGNARFRVADAARLERLGGDMYRF